MSLRSGPAGPVPVGPVGPVPVGPVGPVPVGPVRFQSVQSVRFRSVRSVRFRSVLFFYMSNCRVKNAALGSTNVEYILDDLPVMDETSDILNLLAQGYCLDSWIREDRVSTHSDRLMTKTV